MRRGNLFIILLMAVMLAGAWGSCNGGGGGDGDFVLDATPTLLSTTSVDHAGDHKFDSDGKWMVWEGKDRDRVMLNDGSGYTNLANGLEELEVEEIAYDGRFVVLHAKNPTEPCQDSTAAWADSANVPSWNRAELYVFDTAEKNPELVMVTDDMRGEHYISLDNGLLVYIAYNGDDSIYAVDLNSGSFSPVEIYDYVYASTSERLPFLNGTELVFNDGTYDIIHADLSDLSAAELTTIGYGYSPQVSNGIVVWEYSDEVYATTPGGDVWLNEDIPNQCEDPVVYGDYVAMECWDGADDEIVVAYIGNLSSFAPSVGEDVQWVTDNAVNDRDPLIAGAYLAWVHYDDSDGELVYAVQNVSGIFTDLTLLTDNYAHGMNYDNPWESYSSSSFDLDETGTIVWTEYQDEDYEDAFVEFVMAFTIGVDDAPRVLENYNDFQHIRQLEVVGGTAAWLTRGSHDRIFAYKVGTEPNPVAVTPEGQRGRQPRVDGGILTYQGKPIMECGDDSGDMNEIWYINLNTDAKKAVKVTSNIGDDDRPVVDGANGIIAWVNRDDGIYLYTTISDGEVYEIDDDIDPNCSPEIEDGKIVMKDDDYDVWVYDVSTGVYTYIDCNTYYRPQISEGIVLWLQSDDELYYYDLNDPMAGIQQITDDVDFGYNAGWNVNISAGTVIFEGYEPAGSSTQVIFAYTVGDPTDSVEVIFTATNEDGNGIRQIDVDEDMVVWKYAECDPEIYYHNLSSDVTSAITENYVPEHKPDVKEGVVVWRTGPEGISKYYMAKP